MNERTRVLGRFGLLLGCILLVAGAKGCEEKPPYFPLWPVEHDGVLPLAEATDTTHVRQKGDELWVELEGPWDRVYSRGGHQLSAEMKPVLHLRARIDTNLLPTLCVWSVPEGVTANQVTPVCHPIPKTRPWEVVELDIPLMPDWSHRKKLDVFGFAFEAGAGTMVIEQADVRPVSLPMTAGIWWRSFRSLTSREPNFYLLGLVAITLASWLVVFGLSRIALRTWSPRSAPPRTLKVLAVLILVTWSLEGSRVVLHRFDVLAERLGFLGLSQHELRNNAQGDQLHQLAHIVDQLVPVDGAVALAPAKSQLLAWRVASTIAPRELVPIFECGEVPEDLASDYLATVGGCMGSSLTPQVVAGPNASVGRPWEAVVPVTAPGHYLSGFQVAFDSDSFGLAESARVQVIGESGRVLVDEPLAHRSPHTSGAFVRVSQGAELRIRITVEESSRGDGVVAISDPGFEARVLPPDWGPGSGGEKGSLVSRRRVGAVPGEPSPRLQDEEGYGSWFERLRLLVALAFLLMVGEGSLRLLFWGMEGPVGASRWAYAWLVGAGVVTLGVQIVTWIGAPHWPWGLAPSLVVVGLGLWRGRERSPERPPAGASAPLPLDERVLVGISLGLVVLALITATLVGFTEWDELINWGYRGHLFHHVGPTTEAVSDYAELSPRHKAYPPGVPLSESYFTLAMGRWDARAAKIPFPLYYGALLLLVQAAVRPHSSRRFALFYVALAATAPMAAMMSTIGMADLPLGTLLLGAVLAVERYRGDAATRGWLFLAGLLGALMGWTKLDGGALKLLVFGLAVLHILGLRRFRSGLTHLIGMAVLAFGPILPWWNVYSSLGLSDWVVNAQTLSPERLLDRLGLLPQIFQALGEYLTTTGWGMGAHWGATYVMLLVLVVLLPHRVFGRACRLLAVGLVGGILGYAFIYVVSPQGLHQMVRSLDRILLHYFPLAVALCGRAHASAGSRPVA